MKLFKTIHNQKGFTLLEILLVVAIIAILAGIVIIAINPAKQLADSRNTQRQADATTLLNATWQYMVDNNGNAPGIGSRTGAVALTTTATEICSQTASSCTGLVDLAVLTTAGKYLVAVPKDPSCPSSLTASPPQCTANGNGYTIAKDANGRLTVAAIAGEGKTISVSR
jgi:prepilin-type N-terminal cleavage/methylation domain-containing protein